MNIATSLSVCAALALALNCGVAHAAENAQQIKMRTCNAEGQAKHLSGDARKKFMSSCLSAAPAGNSQQEKMKTCNADAKAKNLMGDERRKFMSSCLSSG